MTISVNTVPAYIIIAFDLNGKVKIQQIQERLVIRDGETVINGNGEGELQPIRLITAPQKNDTVEATLTEALDAATTGALLRVAELEPLESKIEEVTTELTAEREAHAATKEELAALAVPAEEPV